MNTVVPRRPKTDGITLKNKYVASVASVASAASAEKSLNNLT
jgi:hypothetical protein